MELLAPSGLFDKGPALRPHRFPNPAELQAPTELSIKGPGLCRHRFLNSNAMQLIENQKDFMTFSNELTRTPLPQVPAAC